MRLGTTVLSVTRPGSKRRPVAAVPSETYALSSAGSVNEGENMVVTVTTTNVTDNTVLYWSTSNITTSDPDFTATSGTTTITNNSGSFSVTAVADSTTEGAETFGITLRSISQNGPIVASTTNKTINDTSQTPPPPSYSASSASNINEGSALGVTVTTTNVSDGTTLYWTTNHTTTSAADFSSNSGSFTITSNSGTFNVPVVADSTTEGSETFTVEIRTTSTSGTIVATLPSVTVNDTSTSPTYSVSSASTVNEGSTLACTVTTTNVSDGTTLYWTTNHTTTNAADFSSNSGSFTITNNSAVFNVPVVADTTTEGSETFTVEIRTTSTSGTIVATLPSVTVNDTSLDPPGGDLYFAEYKQGVGGVTNAGRGFTFAGNGTKVYVQRSTSTSSDTYQYSLATAWDISSSITSDGSFTSSRDWGYGVKWKPDGSRFYWFNADEDRIQQHTLNSSSDYWNMLGSRTYNGETFFASSYESGLTDIAFSSDGTKIFISGEQSDAIHAFSLSEAWNVLSTVTHLGSSSAFNFQLSKMDMKPDGTIFYLCSGTNIYQFEPTTAYDVTTIPSTPSHILSTSGIATAPKNAYIKDGTQLFTYDTNGSIHEFDLTNNFKNVSNYSHTRFDRINVPTGEAVMGVAFDPTGTKIFTVDQGTSSVKRIRQATLSTAWDISTAGSDTAAINLLFYDTNGFTSPQEVKFNNDGTKMYVNDIAGVIREYNLGSAYNISGLGTHSAQKDFGTQVSGFFWKPDGTALYTIDGSSDRVKKYELATAWSITSAVTSTTQSIELDLTTTANQTIARSLFISPDGLKLYLTGQNEDKVQMYNLSTAWDITSFSGSPDDSLDFSSYELSAQCITFSPGGKYMYISGAAGDGIDQFTVT